MEKSVFNLCEGKGGVQRSRIWLERDRLVRAGFTHGKTFRKTWRENSLVLEVASNASDADTFRKLPRLEFGTVCGSKERPIVDIVGAKVRETFGKHAQIAVSFDEGRITIRSERA